MPDSDIETIILSPDPTASLQTFLFHNNKKSVLVNLLYNAFPPVEQNAQLSFSIHSLLILQQTYSEINIKGAPQGKVKKNHKKNYFISNGKIILVIYLSGFPLKIIPEPFRYISLEGHKREI